MKPKSSLLDTCPPAANESCPVRELCVVVLAVEKMNALDREILDHRRAQVEREFFAEAFRIDVGIEGDRGTLPCESKLSGGDLHPSVCDRLISDVTAIQANRFAAEKIG